MLFGLVGFVFAQFAVNCRNPRVRRDFRAEYLDNNRWLRFVNAYQQMKWTGRITHYAKLHRDITSQIHRNMYFLSWHRAFLWEFENEIRAIGGNDLTLPYIDWAADGYEFSGQVDKGWANHPYFYGKQEQGQQCLAGQIYPTFQKSPIFNAGQCIGRDIDHSYSVASWAAVDNTIFQSYDFGTFSDAIQYGIHSDVHNLFSGDMGSDFAPVDPLFMAHHGFVDLLLNTWQYAHNKYQGFEQWVYSADFQINGRTYNHGKLLANTNQCVQYERWMSSQSSGQLRKRAVNSTTGLNETATPANSTRPSTTEELSDAPLATATESQAAHYAKPNVPYVSPQQIKNYNADLANHYKSVQGILTNTTLNETSKNTGCISKIVGFYKAGFVPLNKTIDPVKLKKLGLDPVKAQAIKDQQEKVTQSLLNVSKDQFTAKTAAEVQKSPPKSVDITSVPNSINAENSPTSSPMQTPKSNYGSSSSKSESVMFMIYLSFF